MNTQETKEDLFREIAERIQKIAHIDDGDLNRPTLITGCVVIYESTLYDDNGNPMVKWDFFSPTDNSILVAKGLVGTARLMIEHRQFCNGEHEGH